MFEVPEWDKWTHRDSWCLWEASALLIGVDPEYLLGQWRRRLQECVAGESSISIDAGLLEWVMRSWELLKEMESSHQAGKLNILADHWAVSLKSSTASSDPGPWVLIAPQVFEAWWEAGKTSILPGVFLDWAQGKGHEIPKELLPLLSAPMLGEEAETKSTVGKHKRLPVTQKVVAVLCGVTEKQVGKWDKGLQTPERYPGRYDLDKLKPWAETYQQRKLISKTARAISRRLMALAVFEISFLC